MLKVYFLVKDFIAEAEYQPILHTHPLFKCLKLQTLRHGDDFIKIRLSKKC